MATPRGKIGRLPETVRNRVNQMLVDNREASEIIAYLDSEGYEGIEPQNISAWKNHGFQKWVERQDRIEGMRDRMEFARALVSESAPGDMTLASDTATRMAVDMIVAVLEDFDPTTLADRKSVV